MGFKDWLLEMDRLAAPKIIKVTSPTGVRSQTRKSVTPSHLGANPAFVKFDGLNSYGQNITSKKSIGRPSDR